MNPLDPQSKRVYEVGGTAPCLPSGGGQEIKSIQPCIALDGDKLKPREDQRKGGNGFGVNEEGAGYTLTGVDRHGVAYCADGVAHSQTIGTNPGFKDGVVIGLDGYNKTLTGDCAPTISGAACDLHHTHGVISTNSNGEDVPPTISSCEYKMGQKQKDTGGVCRDETGRSGR